MGFIHQDDLNRFTRAVAEHQHQIRVHGRAIADEVNYILARGASYTELGACLGISRQAAWDKWGPGRDRRKERWQDHPEVWRDMVSDG